LVQPFSIVNTYDARFYKSTHTGDWVYAKSYQSHPKLSLGVRGMTAQTYDSSATFTIKFNRTVSLVNNLLTMFASQGDSSFVPEIYVDSNRLERVNKGFELYEFNIPNEFKTITLKLIKIKPNQTQFTIYGMFFSNKENKGCIWHNAGVGAAQYQSILLEDKFVEQATLLHPDLVIIDFGTNDILYENIIPVKLEEQIIKVIEKVRKAAPNASIILTTAQDARYKRRHATIAFQFSALIRAIAKKENCAFWDWYYVAGGPYSMKKWMEEGVSMNDGIHLNGKGYEIKASLLFKAIEKSFNLINQDSTKTQFVLETSSIDSTFVKEIDKNRAKNVKVIKLKKKTKKLKK
jgi:lysophospholipase L1-like esterase